MANIGDIFLRLLVDSSDFERQVIAQGEAAGAKAGTAMGAQLAANLSKSATSIGQSLSSIGANMAKTGRSLTTGLTIPLGLAGIAVSKLALDFDTTLRRIIGLTDVTAAQIDGIRESLLAMAEDVGKGPQELAEAMYFVASAGFAAEEALDVLETAARASAAGLGETQDVAQVLGSIINAYGKENITAARAADILTEAVSQGTAESTEFAGVIGRVVPAAAAMGVQFNDVAAALAAMTLSGLSAEEAAVGLNQVFVSLLKPTAQANEAMESVGLSAEGLREQLREEGLLSTLATLEERFAGNETAAAAVFGNVRALRTVTNLLNLDTEQLNDVFGKVENSLGRLQEAYEETEGPQRDLDRATASIESSLASLGEDTLPTAVAGVQALAAALKDFTAAWKGLPPDMRSAIVQLGLFVIAVGPVLFVAGKLVGAFGALFKAIGFIIGPRGIGALTTHLRLAGRAAGRILPWILLVETITKIPDALDAAGDALDGFARNRPRQMLNAIRRLMEAIPEPFRLFVGITDSMIDQFDAHLARLEESTGETFGGWGERWGPVVRDGAEDVVDIVGTVLEDGSVDIGNAADVAVDPIQQAIIDAREKAAEETRNLIEAVESVLSTAPGELEDELDAFFEGLGPAFTTAERTAELAGQASRVEWINAFTSGDPQAEAAAFLEFSSQILDQLELLYPDIFTAGGVMPTTFLQGAQANFDAAIEELKSSGKLADTVNAFDLADQLDAMGEHVLAAYVRGMERARLDKLAKEEAVRNAQIYRRLQDARTGVFGLGESTTKTYADGLVSPAALEYLRRKAATLRVTTYKLLQMAQSPPFTLSRKAGHMVGKTWIDSLVASVLSSVPLINDAVGQVAGALSLSPMAGGLSSYPTTALTVPAVGAAPQGEVNSTVNNYNLNVTGRLDVDAAQDAVDEMRRLQSFSLSSGG